MISNTRLSPVFILIINALLLAALACSAVPGTTPEVEPSATAGPVIYSTPTEHKAEDPVTDEPVAETPQVESADCSYEEDHPIAKSIAETFEVPYQYVLNLYCDGYEFEEILLALETQTQSELSAEDILQMRDDGISWDEIWQDLGLMK